jgi:hypothetical protein
MFVTGVQTCALPIFRQYPFNAADSLTLLEQQRTNRADKARGLEEGQANGAASKSGRYELTKRPARSIKTPAFLSASSRPATKHLGRERATTR